MCHKNANNPCEPQVTIFDTAADQCTIAGPAWKVSHRTGRFEKFFNYFPSNNAKINLSCPIVSAFSMFCGENYVDDENQKEILTYPFQDL